MICKQCSKEFVARRVDARFCSPKCRQTAKRLGEVTPTEKCSHCGAYPGAIFTQEEFRDELDNILRLKGIIPEGDKDDVDIIPDKQ